MSWIYYLLEANLYLTVFFALYLLFFQRETFYNGNRLYLIGSAFLAFVIPLLQLGVLKPAQQAAEQLRIVPIGLTAGQLQIVQPALVNHSIWDFIIPIYLLVVLLFLVKLTIDIFRIVKLYRHAKTYLRDGVKVVLLDAQQSAFSFWNLLFIHKDLQQQEMIIRHELIHIKQKHTLDILLFEAIQIISWFNPLLYVIKKEIKVLHEYIADEMTSTSLQTRHEYAMVLIENSLQFKSYPLANQFFNQSILKRRIIMLNKPKTGGWARLKLLMALPLTGGMLCASTMAFTKDYGYVDLLPEKVSSLAKVSSTNLLLQTNPKKFYPRNGYSIKTGKADIVDQRLIIINGKEIKDNATFHGATNCETVTTYDARKATEKYGEKGKNGAVVITGANIQFLDKPLSIPLPPPPSTGQKGKIKFPPPRVKPSKNTQSEASAKLQTVTVVADMSNASSVVSNTDTQNKIEEVTIISYPATKANTVADGQSKPIKELRITPTSDKMEEVTIIAYPVKKPTDQPAKRQRQN